MLFSSIVFMSRALLGQWISVVLVFVFKLDVASNSQISHGSTVSFDGEFGNFLRDLGSMVYKAKKKNVSENEVRSSQTTQTSSSIKNYRRSQTTYNTQKAILEDVLMMKLVSYYEDKYKLSHLELTTTEKITPENAFTKNNINNYNVIDKDEVLNTYSKPRNQLHYGLNRRMQKDMKRMDDYQVPEVVIF